MATALITGASSGIGVEFARILAREKFSLVLVARRQDRLEEVARELTNRFAVAVETIVADLATDDGIHAIEARLRDDTRPVDFLINNAGFGIKGAFTAESADAHEAVLVVNGLAPLRLTHAAMTGMLARGKGDIINVASVAAFTPGVRPSSTYAASKAFVAALSEGLAPAVFGTGVHISAVCPGWVKSEFHSAAGIGMSKLPGFMWLTPEFVATQAIADHRAGKVLTVPGTIYKVIMGMCRAMPRPLVVKAAKFLAKRSH